MTESCVCNLPPKRRDVRRQNFLHTDPCRTRVTCPGLITNFRSKRTASLVATGCATGYLCYSARWTPYVIIAAKCVSKPEKMRLSNKKSHGKANQNLTWNSYSGSFKIIHLGTSEKPTRGCISYISCLNCLIFLSYPKRWKLPSSTPLQSFDAPSPRNSRENPQIPRN